MLNNDIKVGLEGYLNYSRREYPEIVLEQKENQEYFVKKYKDPDWQQIGYVLDFAIDEFERKGFVKVGFINHKNDFYNIKKNQVIDFKFCLDANNIGKIDEFLLINNVRMTDKKLVVGDLNSKNEIIYFYEFNFGNLKWYNGDNGV